MATDVLAQAIVAHKAGRYAEAIQLYEQALKAQPSNAEALHLLGALLVEQATCVGSGAAVGTCACSGGSHKGSRVLDSGKVQEGLKHLKAAINHVPKCAKYRHSLGVALERAGRPAEALEAFEHAVSKDPNVKSLAAQARLLKQVGRPAAAADVYRHITQLQPDHPTAWFSLGCRLRQMGRKEQAAHAFREHLRVHPGHQEASFWLAALTGDTATAMAAPADLVAGLFDSYAENFDAHLVEQLGYRTPWLLTDVLLEVAGTQPGCIKPPWNRAVDLGCGTGLMGPLLAPHLSTDALEGVDLSSSMVAKAKDRGCYGHLAVEDLVAYLQHSTANQVASNPGAKGYSLVIAADVFVYIGDLKPVLTAAAECSIQGALLAFSTESADGSNPAGNPDTGSKPGFVLNPTGRFAHHAWYLHQTLEAAGYKSLRLQESVIRQNAGRPVHGYLCVAVRV